MSNRIVVGVAGVALALGIVVGAAGAIVVQDRTTPGTSIMNGMPAGMGAGMRGSMMGAGMDAMHDRYHGTDR